MYILTNGTLHRNDAKLSDAPDYKYTYPNPPGPLKPGTKLHDRLRDEIMVRACYARNAIAPRFETWRETDKKLTVFVDMSEKEKRAKELDPNRPTPIVVPITYAALETLMAYMSSVFLDAPIIRYEGVDSTDTLGAMLLELVVNKQLDRFRGALALYTMMRNSFAYGVGLLTPTWEVVKGVESFRGDRSWFDKLLARPETMYEKQTMQFEGNRLNVIDPYQWLPDPNHAIQDIQQSEFQGWISRESISSILTREKSGAGNFLNGLYVKHIDGRSTLATDESGRNLNGIGEDVVTDLVKPVDVIYMNIKLCPSDWGLGRSRYPELWSFGLAGDSVIVLAEPQHYNHNMMPVVAAAPDFDGYSAAPMAKLETVYGMQTLADFLENSHIAARRQSINGTVVYDPMLINGNDLDSPIPGKKIRTRRKAWGKGVKDGIDVLDFGDATRDHMSEISGLSSWIHMAVGTESILRGVPIQGRDRVTAEEYSGTKNAALQRLEKDARVTAYMAMWDLSFMLAKNTQQFMTQNVMTRIAGRHIEELQQVFQQAVNVDPYAISVDFDIDIASYGVPAGGSPEIWGRALDIVGKNPLIAQGVDVLRMFQHWARIAGAKNVAQFMRPTPNAQAQLMADQEVEQGVQAGNLVPFKEAQA